MKDLLTQINKASNIINQNARKGSGDFIVVPPKIVNILNDYKLKQERREKLINFVS